MYKKIMILGIAALFAALMQSCKNQKLSTNIKSSIYKVYSVNEHKRDKYQIGMLMSFRNPDTFYYDIGASLKEVTKNGGGDIHQGNIGVGIKANGDSVLIGSLHTLFSVYGYRLPSGWFKVKEDIMMLDLKNNTSFLRSSLKNLVTGKLLHKIIPEKVKVTIKGNNYVDGTRAYHEIKGVSYPLCENDNTIPKSGFIVINDDVFHQVHGLSGSLVIAKGVIIGVVQTAEFRNGKTIIGFEYL